MPTEYGDACMGTMANADRNVSMSEDCLYINVFTSDLCLKKKDCPVFILVHGGVFIFGNSVQYNDSQMLNKFVKHEIVFVLPAMRLGFFGYFDFGEDYEFAPYNIGLYDLIANLEWVQKEVHNFGGNSIKQCCQAGLPEIHPNRARNLTDQFLEFVNCSHNAQTNRTLPIQEKLQCLRQLSAETINDVVKNFTEIMFHFGPQANGDLFPPIPLVVITAKNEIGSMYDPQIKDIHHICQENLRIFGFYQQATLEACIIKYNDTDLLMRDTYHTIAALECRLNGGREWPVLFDGVERKINWPKSKFLHKVCFVQTNNLLVDRQPSPCYLGIFAQVNRSQHAQDMLYLVGQHLFKYNDEFTSNDILMDKYYPQTIRNFIRGQQPNWLPTDDRGKGYFYLDFEVLSQNKSEQIWPRFVANEWYEEDSVSFFLEYLLAVEQNASQFNSRPVVTNGFNNQWKFINTMVESQFQQTTLLQNEPLTDYQRFCGRTPLLTTSFVFIILTVFGLLFWTKRKRSPPTYNQKVQQYGAI
ncbi:COesterase domain-containing protein [Aphelenchoides bicaudatus]|nr:COesterase domain-containing protein [Aphelenchoides bicaudatus]